MVELQGKALPTWINCGEGFGAIWLGGGAIGVLWVSIGLLVHMGGEGGHGLFALEEFNLNRRTVAIPLHPVIAGLDRFAIDNNLVSQMKLSFISFPSECGRRKQKRATKKQD